MNKSDSIQALAAAYTKAQAEIAGAVKDKTNPAFRSKYADLSSVIDAIKPALSKHGLSFMQAPRDAEHAAKVETILLHGSGEWMSLGEVSVPVTKADAHGFGSALTYARRYGLLAAFGVPAEDDDGNAAAIAAPKEHGANGAGVNKECFEKLPAQEKEPMRMFAADIIALVDDSREDEAYHMIENKRFDELRKPALWSLLDSKTRSAIKRIGEQRRAA